MNDEYLFSSASSAKLIHQHSTTESSLIDPSTILQLLDSGGPVIVILGVMSLFSMAIFLLKLWQFFWLNRGSTTPLVSALESWHCGHTAEALKALSTCQHPVAPVLEAAIFFNRQIDLDEVAAREEITRIAKRELAKARSHLRILEVIATLSPLLGLLGTVLGMIEAFQKLQASGAATDPAVLSGGIWEALLTTAAGLIVAIPTIMILNWLEQYIEQLKLMMEDTVTQIFTGKLPKLSQSMSTEKKNTKSYSDSTELIEKTT